MKCPFCKHEIAGAHVHKPVEFPARVRMVKKKKRRVAYRQRIVEMQSVPRQGYIRSESFVIVVVKDWR